MELRRVRCWRASAETAEVVSVFGQKSWERALTSADIRDVAAPSAVAPNIRRRLDAGRNRCFVHTLPMDGPYTFTLSYCSNPIVVLSTRHRAAGAGPSMIAAYDKRWRSKMCWFQSRESFSISRLTENINPWHSTRGAEDFSSHRSPGLLLYSPRQNRRISQLYWPCAFNTNRVPPTRFSSTRSTLRLPV